MDWDYLPYEIKYIIIDHMTLQSLGRFIQTSKDSKELADDPFVWRKLCTKWIPYDFDDRVIWNNSVNDNPKFALDRAVYVWNLFIHIFNKCDPKYIKGGQLHYVLKRICSHCKTFHSKTIDIPIIIPIGWLETYEILAIAVPKEENYAPRIYDIYENDFWIPNYQNLYPNMIAPPRMNVLQMVNPWHGFMGGSNGAMNRREARQKRRHEERAERQKRRLGKRAERQRTTYTPPYTVQVYPTKKETKKQMKKFAPNKLKMQNKRINLNSNLHKQKYR